ncbi:MAG TPA: DNA damage-inducible protein D, partial [Candidatus Faecivivens stercorigallinarum]|nr:DNA damage-inducible protein D [Candidatus Faecivivens stercorigallinarum]
MDKKRIRTIKEQFDMVVHQEETVGIEFWYARELMPLLGYERWENFEKTIERAMMSCQTAGGQIFDHFREIS